MHVLTSLATKLCPLWMVLTLAAAACGDDDELTTDPALESDAGPDAASPDAASPDASTADQEPAYLVVERVFTQEGRFYYASVLPEMPTSPVDRDQAREFSSADIEVFAGKVFLRDRESNILKRFSVSPERKLVEEAEIGFQSLGLSASRIYNAYVSPTSAFILSDDDWNLIEWNPTTMELTGKEISIDFARKDVTGYVGAPTVVANRILSPVFWQDYETFVTYPGSGVLVIDPSSPDEPRFIEDDRLACGAKIAAAGNGDAYLIGTVFGEFRMFGTVAGGGELPSSGMLRIPAGAEAFDTGYRLDLDEITGSPNIWGAHRIDDRYLLLQMWDPESTVEIKTQEDLDDGLEYIYALVDTEERSWKRVDTLPKAGAGNSISHRVDGKLYIQAYMLNDKGDGSEDAVVYTVTPEGFEEQFRVPSGDLWFAERIR
ncbi:MAG: DUF4374 domain-containing protein [Polyangiales bacterium]